ncbi:dTDP-4-dehydrorhamnose 3,5-epimerase [Devosia sp. Leaf64]|uniref:dTDP-4-dehydrorhamnose 3,5-epimerase n=1 Tax=Devosia sp. Leaf64 TaxID=1736229 RepID=UPI000715AB8A|nr:dTDP-4-dehydrorhamnose 3,5-epimerase [Devosia sp. Leaf64]KQN74631.1 dTDP-4-dehydrorhamnose 3,5-epimerase [Devosia sp. Leaf64]
MSLSVRRLSLPGVLEIVPTQHSDDRGLFSEVWNAADLARHGVIVDFIQDNHSISRLRGVMRGLHYQLPPFAQDKLVRVVRGAIFDVAVDINPDSQTFGQWVSAELSATRWNQLFVPAGYAHGFVTTQPDTEVIYKVSNPYSCEHERSIRFDDPQLAIAWPIKADDMLLSEKDRLAPTLDAADLPAMRENVA